MHLKMDKFGGLAIIYYLASFSSFGSLLSSYPAAAETSAQSSNSVATTERKAAIRVAQEADASRAPSGSVQTYAAGSTRNRASSVTSQVKIIDNDDQQEPETTREESAGTVTLCAKAKDLMERGKPGDLDAAISLVYQALTRDTGSAAARRLYAQALVQKRKPGPALEQLRILQTIDKANAVDYCTYGDAYFQQSELQPALSSYEQSLKLDRNWRAKAGQIRALAKLDRIDEALNECKQALRSFPEKRVNDYFDSLYKALYEYKQTHAGSNSGAPSSTPAVPPPLSPDIMPPFLKEQVYGKGGGG